MMSGNAKTKIERTLLYLMLVFSCISYMGYFFYSVRNGITVLVSYSRSNQTIMQNSSFVTLAIRFGKDICAILLLIIECFSMNRSKRGTIFLGIVFFISYGTLISIFNYNTLSVIIAGYRMMLYFIVLIMYFNANEVSPLSIKKLYYMVTILLAINIITGLVQIILSIGSRIDLIGKGSYRYMGVFPSAAAFGYFCLGAVLFFYCISAKLSQIPTIAKIMCLFSVIGCFMSGSRSAIINMMIILYCHILGKARIKQSQKIILGILLLIPAITLSVGISSNIASRGSILANAISGGRISVFIKYGFNRPFLNVLFGNGIGAGSNSAAELLKRSGTLDLIILDGTFTSVFYQYGIPGAIIIVHIIIKCFKNIHYNMGLSDALVFTGTIILQCLTSIILEDYSLLILIFISYYVLVNGEGYFIELGDNELAASQGYEYYSRY